MRVPSGPIPRRAFRVLPLLFLATLTCLLPDAAAAQPREPIGPFVVDARGTFARFKEDQAIAGAIDVAPASLPTRGLGLALGAHWYPLRVRGVTLGLGGEIVYARDSRTPEPPADPGAVAGPTVTTRLTSISPHVSLNFGKGDGWSYISGGLGQARLTAERADEPFSGGSGRARATHYGGGARWFTSPHLAFTFDVRFYAINALPAAGTRPAFPRTRFMVFSVGAAVK